ncbi:MAG: polysaccharide biosynthesis C-terminal domain-containing protein, partial [Acetobacteraceae bacterium]|nr:polysaccharide biosynthesis C-terminal domain-containing protein [Acetobacteraceae bacterium]
EAGVYAMAFNIAALTVLPRVAVNALFAPMVAALHARRDMAGLQVLTARASVWTLVGACAFALPIGVCAEPLLRWFGPDFTAGVGALRTLLAAQVLAASAGSQLYLLTMTGHERSAAVLMLATALGNFGIAAWLIPFVGLTGAALALSVTLIIGNGAMAVLVWRFLHIVPGVLAALRPPASGRGAHTASNDRKPLLPLVSILGACVARATQAAARTRSQGGGHARRPPGGGSAARNPS